MDSYIANRSSFLQKEVVISSGCEQQIIMFVFFSLLVRLCILQLFYCSFAYCTCIKQLFKASLNGAMKIKIKLKTTGFYFFFSNSIENTKVVNNFVQYRVVWLHHKQYKFWIYEQICRTLILKPIDENNGQFQRNRVNF